MNNDIRNALLDLFSVCLEVNGAGRFHAHMTYSAHVDSVTVYVLPADTNYQARGYEHSFWHDVYLNDGYGRASAQIVSNIAELAAKVGEFLLPATEAAA
jgi:hypothetical protein